jgi:hypothetical protein
MAIPVTTCGNSCYHFGYSGSHLLSGWQVELQALVPVVMGVKLYLSVLA